VSHWDPQRGEWVPDAYPPPGQHVPGAPGPRRGASQGLLLAVVGVVAAGLIGAVVALTFGGGDGPQSAPSSPASSSPSSPAPSQSATGSSTPPSPSSPVSSAPAPTPTGFTRVADPDGFSLLVPRGWVRKTQNGSVYYDDPRGGDAGGEAANRLQIMIDYKPDATPYEALASLRASKRAAAQGYEEAHFDRLSADGGAWDYAYDHPTLGRRQIAAQALSGDDGHQYILLVRGSPTTPARQRDILQKALTSFCAGKPCSR
jgi:hypothetical protein